ncbi:4-hydroxythreonine-4-phosphate dehydrogenase [Altererythrobacter atlanticus]|uniref:4-hydroxythreonine-4-phosphate dehydrogenase n=1 Tax=Croceibacterium atlanticum TaxID=1267766 RepID=A0A0F7KSC5_9SPHN|nr:4-hydroxythreonine-4-phosphate dehydrogenase PdxA [Croceibacterium atlanticum]AKH42172.1 4-hydroxythreonine-4-phosphate dehydrogenase 1 [Croceibacterium atlanticum]MBB5734015.1 4-hydroxythreonine-4-phosphate dehydrogenase [Croceibacterium atlanticum]
MKNPVPEAPLALSLGDPAGIGPELICEAWSRRISEGFPPFFAVGGAGILRAAAERRGLDVPVAIIGDPAEAATVFGDALPVLGTQDGTYRPGKPDEHGAELALASLETATALAVQGKASALVTGPIAKAELAKIGFTFPGQTEFLAAACGMAAEDAVMMLAGPQLRTVPLTVHCAIADVPGRITKELILRRARVVDAAMRRDFGLPAPRIAVCGLNPHAGENGRMGREEIETIAPAIAMLQAEGIGATGPHPADSLFAPHSRGNFDVAIAMYHDQALVPMKALDFDSGVNMTLGLPIVRTSADHGTAFGIAGTGAAHPGATLAAIRMAAEAAARRAKA